MSMILNYYVLLEESGISGSLHLQPDADENLYDVLLAFYDAENSMMCDRIVPKNELRFHAPENLKKLPADDLYARATASLKDPLDTYDKIFSIWSEQPCVDLIHLVVLVPLFVASPPFRLNASISPRENTVAGIWQKLMKYSFLWVRGTPGSGKTILANLVHHHARKVLPSAVVLSMVGWRKDEKNRLGAWKFLNRRRRRGVPTIYIFDSAQMTYDDTNVWLNFFKTIYEQRSKDEYVIAFCSYGNPLSSFEIKGHPMKIDAKRRITLSPIDHNDGCPAVGLLLTKEEFGDVIDRRYGGHGKHFFEEKFLTQVFEFTGGHSGAISNIFRFIEAGDEYTAMKPMRGGRYTLDTFQREYPPDVFIKVVRHGSILQRGLPHTRDLDDPAVSRILSLVAQRTVLTDEYISEDIKHGLSNCTRRGWLHSDAIDDNKAVIGYHFASPFHQWFIEWMLFSSRAPESPLGGTLLEFVWNVVLSFDARMLSQEERRIGPGSIPRLPGTQFQDEFCHRSHLLSGGSLQS
ncbi:hypothetical protein BDN72DRAFT_843491 [Pluteus cervinus]|uniref:Uncharacterized protein n=1 Tax=Pluteus cervinus TaxID=181527 RepID=A0ACD3APD0_9AGAR|nr:hypothetical protein BDN72DRAFT_843491 [Pluteus cervinus]